MELKSSQLKALVDSVRDALVVIDDAGYCLHVNAAACTLFGRSQTEIEQQFIADLGWPAESLATFQAETLAETLGDRPPQRIPLTRADGSQRWVDWSIMPHFGTGEHLWILRDVTDLHNLEQEVARLRQTLSEADLSRPMSSEVEPAGADSVPPSAGDRSSTNSALYPLDQLYRFLDALPVCIAYIDHHGYYRYVNANYQNWFNLPRQDIINQSLVSILGEAAYTNVEAYIQRTLTGETLTFETEMPYQRGKARYTRTTLIPDCTEQGVAGFIVLGIDMSDRRQLELALQASQQKYQTLFNILPIGVAITDRDGQIIEANPVSEAILGLSISEQRQRTYDAPSWQIIDPDHRLMPTTDYPSVRALQENHPVLNVEQGLVRPDGQVRWICTSAAPIPLEDYGVAIAYIDITDRKITEQALQHNEACFTEISEASPCNIYIIIGRSDGSFYFEYISRAIEHIHELRVEDILVNPNIVLDCIYPDDRPGYDAAVQRSLESLSPFLHEWRIITPSGVVKWLQGNSRPQRRDNGDVAWYGVVLDVTDRKQAEIALQTSEARFAAAFHSSPDVVLISRYRDGLIMEVNNRFVEVSGYTVEEAIGKTTLELNLWDSSQSRAAAMEYLQRHGSIHNYELTFRKKTGELRTALMSGQLLTIDGDTCLLSVVRDISDRKQMEQALQAANERYNHVLQSIGEGIWDWDYQTHQVTGSLRFWEILGEPMPVSGQLSDHVLLDRLYPGDAERLQEIVIAHLQERSRYSFELRIRHHSGQYIWIRSRGQGIWNADGTLRQVIGSIEDISDRKAAEADLYERAMRERALNNVVQAIRSSLDLDAIFTLSVVQIAKLLEGEVSIVQYLPEHSLWRHVIIYNEGEGYSERLEQDIPDAGNPFADRLKRLEIIQIDDTTIIQDDPVNQPLAEKFPGAWLLVPINVGGQVWGSLTLARPYRTTPWLPENIDLAQRLADQLAIAIHQSHLYQQLQASEAKLSMVLRTAAAAIVSAQVFGDRTYFYDYCSNRCEEIFGFTAEEFIADYHLWWSRVHPEDIETHAIPSFDLVFTEQPIQFEYRFQRKDGSWRWLSLSATSQWDTTIQGWRVTKVNTDISDRKQQEAETIRRNAYLQQQQLVMMELSQRQELYTGDLDSALRNITRTAAHTLSVERVSVWWLNPESTELRCAVLYLLNQDCYESGLSILAMDYPTYFDMMERNRIIAADDITSDPRIAEFADSYLSYYQISSMIDVPIRSEGNLLGVLCFEHLGPSRHWDMEEQHFAAYLANLVALIKEVSDRKAAELALRQSEATNQAILSALPDLLIQIHRDGTYLKIYRSTGVRLVNSNAVEVGSSIYQVMPPTMATERMDVIFHALEQKKLQIHEYTVFFEDETRYEEARIVPMEEDTALVLVRDITDRRIAEQTLRQREQEFRTLAENAPDCIMRCDRQFRFLYVNPVVANLTHIPAEEFIGKTSSELGFPESLVYLWHNAAEQVFVTAQENSLEYNISLQTGYLTFYSRIVPEYADDGSVHSVLILSRDITELKRAQLDLLHQAEREHSLRLITQHIRETLDLNQILNTAVTEVQRILNADRTLIFRLNADHSGIVIQEVVRPEYPITLEMYWENECFPQECHDFYIQGKARIVDNAGSDTWGRCLATFMRTSAVQSKMVAPITQHQPDGSPKLWGLLITHACATPRQWQPGELELLQQVADQLAIAIQQSQLYQQIQQWADTLEEQVESRTTEIRQGLELESVLKRITDRVRDSLDEEQILDTAVSELGKILQLDCCDTGIYNADLTTSTIAHEFTQSLSSARGTTFEIAQATHREIYPYLFKGDVLQFCDLVPCALRTEGRKMTILACPIQDDQAILGDMWLMRSPPECFTDLEMRLVRQVANQCAIALRQARLYKASQVQVVELERLNQLKDDFLSTVSHELRTPMANIKMATELLEMHLKDSNVLPENFPGEHTTTSPIARYFLILKNESRREINLIDDLLDLTRLDAKTEPLVVSSVHLQDWLPHILESFVTRTQQQQQQLIINIPENLPAFLTDSSYFQRIMSELLHNACKYTPPGEEIYLEVSYLDDILNICIRNHGVEIPLSERDRIFDRFYRIPNSDPWRHGGTGLGLALVKKLVDYLGGEIRVEGGNGYTEFILRFPLQSNAP